MTSAEISKKYFLTRSTIIYRAKKSNINSEPKKKRIYTDEEVNSIVNYQNKKHISKQRGYNKNKIDIIEMYLNSKYNSCTYIADSLNLSWHYVSRIINEWLENDNTITVISDL